MSEGDRERRESGRAALELPVEYDRLNALLSDYTHNISRGGTFIRTDQPLQVGTVLSFTIRAPALVEPIVLRGVVRWVVDPGQASGGRPSGMGVGFVYDSLAEKDAIEGRLDRLMVESLGRAAFEKLMDKAAPGEPPEDGSR
jgi:type IV pilus assembly protein PilZ